jgi:hypothetical protein
MSTKKQLKNRKQMTLEQIYTSKFGSYSAFSPSHYELQLHAFVIYTITKRELNEHGEVIISLCH